MNLNRFTVNYIRAFLGHFECAISSYYMCNLQRSLQSFYFRFHDFPRLYEPPGGNQVAQGHFCSSSGFVPPPTSHRRPCTWGGRGLECRTASAAALRCVQEREVNCLGRVHVLHRCVVSSFPRYRGQKHKVMSFAFELPGSMSIEVLHMSSLQCYMLSTDGNLRALQVAHV